MRFDLGEAVSPTVGTPARSSGWSPQAGWSQNKRLHPAAGPLARVSQSMSHAMGRTTFAPLHDDRRYLPTTTAANSDGIMDCSTFHAGSISTVSTDTPPKHLAPFAANAQLACIHSAAPSFTNPRPPNFLSGMIPGGGFNFPKKGYTWSRFGCAWSRFGQACFDPGGDSFFNVHETCQSRNRHRGN